MKKILTLALTLLLLVGCGNSNKPVLKVYNWGEYIDRDVVAEFEDEFGVRVQYDVFTSNELMYTKLASESYDVIIPSDYMIQRLIEEDRLQEIDFSKIPNFANVDSAYKNRHFDAEGKYAVPYFVGSVGLVYNTKVVDGALIEKEGWNILNNTEFKDRTFFYDSERDAFMVALKSLGYSMNTSNEKELQEAYDWLVNMKKTMNPVYVDDYVIDAMASGERDIAVMYSGDATYVLSENEDLAYLEPKEGTNVWIDAMVITKEAENVDLAHEFINFILENENSKAISLEVGYTSPIPEVSQSIAQEDYEGISSYIPRRNYEKDEEFFFNQEMKALMNELWSKVTAIK